MPRVVVTGIDGIWLARPGTRRQPEKNQMFLRNPVSSSIDILHVSLLINRMFTSKSNMFNKLLIS